MATAPDILRIGNAQGFWGDRPEGPAALVAQSPDLDYLTLDYLAEVSMSILAKQRQRDPEAGYARDFLEVVSSMAPVWKAGRPLRLVTNAGGLNPAACARAARAILREAGCKGLTIGIVTGDDVLDELNRSPDKYPHLETGRALSEVRSSLVTGSAYIGAGSIVEALSQGAQLIVTGRVADPSLVVGPCLYHFGWKADDYDRIAGATVAGHLIECGVQVTGGISTDWLNIPGVDDIGFPIVEVSGDGSCVVTKPRGTGGRVDRATVTEQLVYEIGDPENYLSPDATVSFGQLRLAEDGENRIRVTGARGRPPPESYKVSGTYRAGYRAAGTLVVFGRGATEKARRCGQMVLNRLAAAGMTPQRSLVECLGSGDAVKGVATSAPIEVVLRIAISDPRREVVEYFTRQLMPLVTAGPPGTTGYADGRPSVREEFGYWPTLVRREVVRPVVEIIET